VGLLRKSAGVRRREQSCPNRPDLSEEPDQASFLTEAPAATHPLPPARCLFQRGLAEHERLDLVRPRPRPPMLK
jgi:hypothetical protein